MTGERSGSTVARRDGHGGSPAAFAAGDPPRALTAAASWGWRVLVVAAVALLCAVVVGRLAVVALPIAGALLAATVLAPPVEALVRRRWPRALATWAVVGVVAALAAGAGYGLWVRARASADELSLNLGRAIDDVEAWLVAETPLRDDQVARGFDEAGRRAVALAEGGVLGGARTAIEIVGGLVLAIVLTFFFVKDGHGIWRWIVGVAPERQAGRLDGAGRAAWSTLGGWVRGTAVVAAGDALLVGVALWVLDVPLVIPLMVITFAAAFIPFVGAFVAGTLAVLVALASGGVVDALLVLAAVTAVQQIEGNVLQPVVVGRAVRLHPVAILLALAAGTAVAGIAGALVAVPALAASHAATAYLRRLSRGDEAPPGDAP